MDEQEAEVSLLKIMIPCHICRPEPIIRLRIHPLNKRVSILGKIVKYHGKYT